MRQRAGKIKIHRIRSEEIREELKQEQISNQV